MDAGLQADVVRACGITQLLDAALAGFHVTIFAYGQTGSGKTFTMSGREDVLALDDYAGTAQPAWPKAWFMRVHFASFMYYPIRAQEGQERPGLSFAASKQQYQAAVLHSVKQKPCELAPDGPTHVAGTSRAVNMTQMSSVVLL